MLYFLTCFDRQDSKIKSDKLENSYLPLMLGFLLALREISDHVWPFDSSLMKFTSPQTGLSMTL